MVETPESALLVHLVALRRRWAVASLGAAGVLAVLVPVSLGLPNVYRSSASLLVNPSPDALLQSRGAGEIDERLQSIKQEALSRTRLTQLIAQFDLYPNLRAKGAIGDAVDSLQKDVKVEITSTSARNGQVTTVAFKVSYVGADPSTVANVANRLALFYVEKNDAMRSGQVSRTADFLKQELDATKLRLDLDEQKLIDFTTSNVGALPKQIDSTLAKYGQLTQQLQMHTSEQLRLMDRRDSVQNEIANLSMPGASVDVTDPSMKVVQAQRELDALKLRFADSMPEVRAKKQEIAALQTMALTTKGAHDGIDTTAPSRLATLQSQIASINVRLDQIKKSSDEAHASLLGYDALLERAPVRDAQFEKISRDVQFMRERYDSLQKRYQDSLAAERAGQGEGGEDFRVLDPAVPALGPASPDRKVLLGGSMALALGLGIGLALLLEWFDTSFRSVDELRAFTHVPVLAMIPVIVTRGDKFRGLVRSCAIGTGASVALAVVGAGAFHVAQRAEPITRLLLRLG